MVRRQVLMKRIALFAVTAALILCGWLMMNRKEHTRTAYGSGKKYIDGPDVLSIERLAHELGMKDYEVVRVLLEKGDYPDITREVSPDQYAHYRSILEKAGH